MKSVNVSLACLPGMRFEPAILRSLDGLHDPELGELNTEHLQLCPQNFGVLTVDLAQDISRKYSSKLRLHANVRVLPKMIFADLSSFKENQEWFLQAAKVSQALNAPAYTLHAGNRSEATLNEIFDYVKEVEDLFMCDVGIEGLYPTKGNKYLVSTWDEYSRLLSSGVKYALDLSHLNILSSQTNVLEINLVKELLSSDKCIEIHLSSNDGVGDTHQKLDNQPWWFKLLGEVGQNAVLFSEGNQISNVKPRIVQ